MLARTALNVCVFWVTLFFVIGITMVQAETKSKEELNGALFEACDNGDLKEAQELIAQGADVNATGLFSETPLMRAASSGHAHVVEGLISKGADVNAKAWRGVTALMDAATWSDDVKVLQILLDHRAEINAADEDGWTALMQAADRGRLDMVRLLLDRGADINATCRKGSNALWAAAENNHCNVVQFLRKQGAAYDVHSAAAVGDMVALRRYASSGGDVNSREKHYGRSLLWMASHNGHTETVAWLLDNKADVEAQGPNGETPLHAAAESGHHEVVALLLEKGANIQAYSEGMRGTPLHFACLYGHQQTVESLLSRGAGIETRTKGQDSTPLMIASGSGKVDVVRLLVKRGALVNAVNEKGQTALMVAAEVLEVDTMRELVDAGADVHRKDKEDQMTALHYVCCTGECPKDSIPAAELLIQMGAKVTETDGEGFLPLHCAASEGCEDLTALLLKAQQEVPLSRAQLEKALLLCTSEGNFKEKIASMLLEAGASVNCSDTEGNSPLIHAAQLGDANAVLFLTKHGAGKSIRNAEGATALDIAKRSGQYKIVELLQGLTQK